MVVKTLARRALDGVGVYQRLRASRVYDLYWRTVDRRIVEKRDCDVRHYREWLEGLDSGGLIFDIGANHGAKTDVFLRLGARVIAVEPDPMNQLILRQKFIDWRLTPRPVTIVGQAVSNVNTVGTMWIDKPGSAKNTLSPKWVETLRKDTNRFGHSLAFRSQTTVTTTTLDDLIATYGPPFFIKIDVEGLEVAVLRGLHQVVPYLSFEVNLPEFRSEGLECIDILAGITDTGRFNYVVDGAQHTAGTSWLTAALFSDWLTRCDESNIEVLWKSGASR